MRPDIPTADVLALLEDRPYRVVELAALFGVSRYFMRLTLARLHNAGLIEPMGPERCWRLAPPEPVAVPVEPVRVRSDGVEYESVWNGRDSLDVLRPELDATRTCGLGQSLARAHSFISTGRRA